MSDLVRTTNLLVLVSEQLGWDILVGHPGKVGGGKLLKKWPAFLVITLPDLSFFFGLPNNTKRRIFCNQPREGDSILPMPKSVSDLEDK